MPNIANDVYTITARPDRTEETLLGIRHALQIAHSSEDFPKDVQEIRLQANQIAYDMQAQISVNVRKVSHIVPSYINPDGSFTRGDSLLYVEPRAFHSRVDTNRNADFYYIAGQTLNIKIRRPTPYFEFGYWAYPDLSVDAINKDWIVLGYPEIIVEGAAAAVYRAIGDAQNAAVHQGIFADLLSRLRTDVLHLGDVADMSIMDTGGYDDWGGQG